MFKLGKQYQMAYADIIGFIGGALTTLALVPQAVKAWRTKHARDISIWWILTSTIGVFLWLVYGILIGSLPIIVTNIATFILAVIVLILKMKYDNQ